jgi:hypothetical protein
VAGTFLLGFWAGVGWSAHENIRLRKQCDDLKEGSDLLIKKVDKLFLRQR